MKPNLAGRISAKRVDSGNWVASYWLDEDAVLMVSKPTRAAALASVEHWAQIRELAMCKPEDLEGLKMLKVQETCLP